ncbi:TetR family transcriptional regulator [Actinosynnema sp. NPDC047251]|uniref:Transcriptional regulator, TetR family n=1 Tax=Saccharothrix espanaensis (strain ATCC 51144 / DSM 44229 / JCM 9112 / NBRC 15066 / NRRL 15764) TaxID=1179773 RepID=K0K3N7_SACES|nr:TetR family transcriptional regulator [Saccharothrix espanaensis]CCH31128.1 Transcriptional regulator, TetR family [Saccharothrix espanaensis DSM 44229]
MVSVPADVDRTPRAGQVDATRRRILDTAERLFAEQGLRAVSHRRISAAAGQGNNAAVGYHFGAKADLVRAIVRRHALRMDDLRTGLVAAAGGSADLRTWVGCLVRPVTTHLAALGAPTWYARFGAQVATDPTFRHVLAEEALSTPGLRRVVDGLHRCLPDLPDEVRLERGDMVSALMVHVCAERERALADGTPQPSWEQTATGLVDAITGLLTAPAS